MPGQLRYGLLVIIEVIARYWALAAASVLVTAIGLFVAYRLYTDSAAGQLRARARDLEGRYRAADKAGRTVEQGRRHLEKLRAKANSVTPRRLQEASDALQDAEALQKIAADQVLIAENHVRKTIHELFPPRRQAALRDKYLRSDAARNLPYTFR